MLAVKLGVKGVIEEHARKVKTGRPQTEQPKTTPRPASAQPPPRQAIRPYRRQVRDSSQDEQGPPFPRPAQSRQRQIHRELANQVPRRNQWRRDRVTIPPSRLGKWDNGPIPHRRW